MEKKIDNEYLNNRLAEIVNQDNFFDVILQLKEFEKEYKTSDFYKTTKLNLMDLIKDARIFYLTNVQYIVKKINEVFENVNSEKLLEILDETGNILEANNQATLEQIKEFKDAGGEEIIEKEKIIQLLGKKN